MIVKELETMLTGFDVTRVCDDIIATVNLVKDEHENFEYVLRIELNSDSDNHMLYVVSFERVRKFYNDELEYDGCNVQKFFTGITFRNFESVKDFIINNVKPNIEWDSKYYQLDNSKIIKFDDELLKLTNEFADSVLGDVVKHLVNVVKDVEPETHKEKAVKLIQECL